MIGQDVDQFKLWMLVDNENKFWQIIWAKDVEAIKDFMKRNFFSDSTQIKELIPGHPVVVKGGNWE